MPAKRKSKSRGNSRAYSKKRKSAKSQKSAKTGALFDPLGLSNLDTLMYTNPVYSKMDPGYILRKTAVYTPATPRVMPDVYTPPLNATGESLYAPSISQRSFQMQGGANDDYAGGNGFLPGMAMGMGLGNGMDILADSSMMAAMNPQLYGPMMNMQPGMMPYMNNILANPYLAAANHLELKDRTNVVRNNSGELPYDVMQVQSQIKKPGYPGFVPPPERLAIVSQMQL